LGSIKDAKCEEISGVIFGLEQQRIGMDRWYAGRSAIFLVVFYRAPLFVILRLRRERQLGLNQGHNAFLSRQKPHHRNPLHHAIN
jgi:hypothetical protein